MSIQRGYRKISVRRARKGWICIWEFKGMRNRNLIQVKWLIILHKSILQLGKIFSSFSKWLNISLHFIFWLLKLPENIFKKKREEGDAWTTFLIFMTSMKSTLEELFSPLEWEMNFCESSHPLISYPLSLETVLQFQWSSIVFFPHTT